MEIRIKKLIIERDAYSYPLTKRIKERLKGVEIKEWVPQWELTKDTLHLLVYKGSFLKPCPGTKSYICCKYQIFNIATNCPMDCSYCILQAYFQQPELKVFVNIEEGLRQVLEVLDKNPEKIFRIGTGEFTDSLALDPIVGWSEIFLPEFSKRKNAILELKTKTDNIKNLIKVPYRERIIVSWSLNSQYIACLEEHGAVSVRKRIESAMICQKEGFIVGFHFDPLIYYKNWKEDYLRIIEIMDRYIDPKKIIWISLGSFRYMPELKDIIRKRHRRSILLHEEFIKGLDGKLRYIRPIREELYSFMYEKLNEWYPDLGIYLCMESDEVWRNSFGWSPKNSEGLKRFLDERVIKFYG